MVTRVYILKVDFIVKTGHLAREIFRLSYALLGTRSVEQN